MTAKKNTDDGMTPQQALGAYSEKLGEEAMRLLQSIIDSKIEGFTISKREYLFGEKIFSEGRWFKPSHAKEEETGKRTVITGRATKNPSANSSLDGTEPGKEPPGTAYIGIAVDKRLEVSIGENYGERGGVFFRPNAIILPGEIFGTFEACDSLHHLPSAHNYTVFSGTPTFYFSDPILDPFGTAKKGEENITNTFCKRLDLLTSISDFENWGWVESTPKKPSTSTSSPSDSAIRFLKKIMNREDFVAWKANILLISVSPRLLSGKESEKIAAIINSIAWRQSSNLRISGIENHNTAQLAKKLNEGKGTNFPSPFCPNVAKELVACRQVILGQRPGFRKYKASPGAATKTLGESGPFSAFFIKLAELIASANQVKGTNPPKIEKDLEQEVYLPDYLYSDQNTMIYPIWMHSEPEGKRGSHKLRTYAQGYKCLDLLFHKKEVDKILFQKDSAYASKKYRIEAKQGLDKGIVLLRGHALIEPLIPKLPTFDRATVPHLSGKADGIVAVQHLLEETLLMFKEIIDREIATPESITVIGKPYSSNPEIAERFRQLGINAIIPEEMFEAEERLESKGLWKPGKFTDWFDKKVYVESSRILGRANGTWLLLDDGGALVKAATNFLRENSKARSGKREKLCLVAVEQTSRGIANALNAPFPVVLVACSWLKTMVEPEFVARCAVTKLARYEPEVLQQENIGIIGLGNVGYYFGKYLLRRSDIFFKKLFVYDTEVKRINNFIRHWSHYKNSDEKEAEAKYSVSDLVNNCDAIYGCSGKNTGVELFISDVPRTRFLISLSSNDIEFSGVLGGISRVARPFDRIVAGEHTHVVAGGFPITFDRESVSAPLIEMQLTRALLLAGAEQAISLVTASVSGAVALDPTVQFKIWNTWKKETTSRWEDEADPQTELPDPGIKAWITARGDEDLGNLADPEVGNSIERFKEGNKTAFTTAIESAIGN